MQYQINDYIDNYKIIRVIGKGSFGTVYEAVKTEGKHTYRAAIKVISISDNDDHNIDTMMEGLTQETLSEYYNSVLDELVDECALMEEMKGDSHIVSYETHSVNINEDETEWQLIIRMELLAPFVKGYKKLDSSMQEKDVVKLGIDICRALETCEKMGKVIHRDIKPENIFVSKTGNYKLGDFGIAKVLGDRDAASSKKGTEAYMAPEVFKGQAYGPTVDIYSLGLVLYRLMNRNRAPFLPPAPQKFSYTDNKQSMQRRINGNELFNKPQDASEAFSEIILKACAPVAEQRYQHPYEMRKALEQLYGVDVDSDYPLKIWEEVFINNSVENFDEMQSEDGVTISVFRSNDSDSDIYMGNGGTLGRQNYSGIISIKEEARRLEEMDKTAGKSVVKKDEDDNRIDEDKKQSDIELDKEFSTEKEEKNIDNKADDESELIDQMEIIDDTAGVNSYVKRENTHTLHYIIVGLAVVAVCIVIMIFVNKSSENNEHTEDLLTEEITTEEDFIEMPDLYGMTKEEVETHMSTYAQINIVFEDEELSLINIGKVCRQEPNAGTNINDKESVIVYFNKGISMPQLVGADKDSAESAISTIGLKNVEYIYTESEGTPDIVISQSIEEGTLLDENSEVVLEISTEITTISVPNVIGLSEEDAIELLRNNGFTDETIEISHSYDSTVETGKTISQSIEADQRVEKNTKISIIISDGPKPTSVKKKSTKKSNNNNDGIIWEYE